ncbi:MAG TPA: hypothetical protein VHB20_11910 [Verrucomicrobiae bacterium]|jgi:hypothetical protein|nr:hypothetical protein [Verrucomicrobiae bacterium]
MIQRQTLPRDVSSVARDPKAILVNGQEFVVSGKALKTVSLKRDWHEDLKDPAEAVRGLQALPGGYDVLKFWQRLPDTEPKYPYYKEFRDVAAIPLSTYQFWLEKQLTQRVRNKVRRSLKTEVVYREVPFSDDLVRGMMEIFNQSPLRRGKPMRHYGKSFETVKAEMGADSEEAVFIAAHFQNELIGFIKFSVLDRYAMLTMILDKIDHRDKLTMNGLLSKTVEVCVARKMPYLTYTLWRRGGHAQFQETSGFVKVPVPEYFVPLTLKGKLALGLRLHQGPKGWVSDKARQRLIDLRAKWYAIRYAQKKVEKPES